MKKYKEIYKKNFGEELSGIEELHKATNFCDLIKAVYNPETMNYGAI